MLQIKNTLGGGKPEGLYAWKKCENDTDHTFIDYVVSDKETAYPDGGEKGGYWYEKVVEGFDLEKLGCTKFEEGSFTPTSDVTNITVSHSLNIYPQFAICYSDSITSNNSDYVKKSIMLISTIIVKTYSMYGNDTAKTYEETNANGETNIIFRSGDSYKYFKSGVTYNYVVLG